MNYQNCTSCALCLNRKNVVRGDGDTNAQLVLIGEAPGSTEDKTGLPFTGRAGKLLDTILEEVGFIKKDLPFLAVGIENGEGFMQTWGQIFSGDETWEEIFA